VERPSSWRSLLSQKIQDPRERQSLAKALKVNAVTLLRWAQNTSNPRYQHLRRLLDLVPEERAVWLELLQAEFPDFLPLGEGTEAKDETLFIPSRVYAEVFSKYVMLPRIQRSWCIIEIVLQNALKQLAPQRRGMAVTLVKCMPPVNGRIRSLREYIGYGYTPWKDNLEQQAVFLGMESLAGYVVSSCHPRMIQNSKEYTGILPGKWDKWERSAAAYPIFRADRVAGCLLVSCAEPNYFTTARLKLIEHHAELLVLAFEAHEFYELQAIQLKMMPKYTVQDEHLKHFRARVNQLIQEEGRKGRALEMKQAEQEMWKIFENELLEMAERANLERTILSPQEPPST